MWMTIGIIVFLAAGFIFMLLGVLLEKPHEILHEEEHTLDSVIHLKNKKGENNNGRLYTRTKAD